MDKLRGTTIFPVGPAQTTRLDPPYELLTVEEVGEDLVREVASLVGYWQEEEGGK